MTNHLPQRVGITGLIQIVGEDESGSEYEDKKPSKSKKVLKEEAYGQSDSDSDTDKKASAKKKSSGLDSKSKKIKKETVTAKPKSQNKQSKDEKESKPKKVSKKSGKGDFDDNDDDNEAKLLLPGQKHQTPPDVINNSSIYYLGGPFSCFLHEFA
jgi:hypothetical protein